MASVLSFDLSPRDERDDRGQSSRSRNETIRDTTFQLPADHPDRPVVDALRAGAVPEFESLYATYAAAVHEFVQRYVAAETANDIVQDVFLTLWRRRESVVITQSVRAYLFGAARLRALQYRRNVRTSDLLNRQHAPRETPVFVDPAEQSDIREGVTKALMTLPGRTRELLALRWVYAMSYTEAAAVLGVSPEAAKKLGRRAEVALAPLLERFRP